MLILSQDRKKQRKFRQRIENKSDFRQKFAKKNNFLQILAKKKWDFRQENRRKTARKNEKFAKMLAI